MKLSLLLTLLLSITGLAAQDSFSRIQLPPEQKGRENLLPDPLIQPSEKNPTVLKTWSNYGGRKLKLTWNEMDGRKVLQTLSDTPGYHMGIRGEAPLQPNTEYIYYAVMRGELAPEAKFVPLYFEVKAGPEKKTVLTRSAGRTGQSFPWTLYSKKFRTPSSFTTGTGAFYLGLIYGSSRIDYACAGLICLGSADRVLPPVNPKYKNLLNNPRLQANRSQIPIDWNEDYAEYKDCFRWTADAGGWNAVTLRPGANPKDATVFYQSDIQLKEGLTYRLGAEIRTRNFKSPHCGLVVYSTAWATDAGLKSLPENTNGWKKMETDIIVPKSRYPFYTFALYATGLQGELSIRRPFLIPVNDQAMNSSRPAVRISRLNRITPVQPLLSQIRPHKPEMTFSFLYELPADDSWECRVAVRMNQEKDFSTPAAFPIREGLIRAALGRSQNGAGTLPEGKGRLKVQICGKKSGRILASAEYPITVCQAVTISRSPERRLNMLTRRLLTAKAQDGTAAFSNPRDGWIYIQFSQGTDKLKIQLDSNPDFLRLQPIGETRETMRYLPAGDHTLKITGAAGGQLIINAIPALLTYGFPRRINQQKDYYEIYHPDFIRNYLLPNLTTFVFGYNLKSIDPELFQDTLRMGKQWYSLTCHLRGTYEDPAKMAERLRTRSSFEHVEATSFDEMSIEKIEDKWVYTQAMWHLTEAARPVHVWYCGGGNCSLHGLNADYLSSVVNNGGGRGQFLVERYSHLQKTEKEAWNFLFKDLNYRTYNMEKLLPGAMTRAAMISGAYTKPGGYCTINCNGPDIKVFWDMFFWKLANEREFQDLSGIGGYSFVNADEESIRWMLRLFRHYGLEGNTWSLAEQYGYTYLPGLLKNGDFEENLKGWQATPADKDSITVKTIPKFGSRYEKRCVTDDTGSRLCRFRHSARKPNLLTQTMTGFIPGRLYALRLVSADENNLEVRKMQRNSLSIRLDGAQDLTAGSKAAKFRKQEECVEICRSGAINNHLIIFRPLQKQVTLTISDWVGGVPPKNLSATLFNMVNITPYYNE